MDSEEDEAAMEEARTFWMSMTTQTITCYVNIHNPDEVLHKDPSWHGLMHTPRCQAIVMAVILTKVCFWILVVRHLCNACNRTLSKGKTVTPRENVPSAPYVLAGNVEENIYAKQAKELEALSVQPNVMFVAPIPPSYQDANQEMVAPPPPYDPYKSV